MPPLSSDNRRALLALARQAILEAVLHERIPDLEPSGGLLAEGSGAFVTLYLRGRLRGCIGRTERNSALAETVAQCAISAALHDPRFEPLGRHEIEELEIAVSVLSALQPIAAEAIEVGKHGLFIRRGERSGLLLPQVAAERNWSVERFLEETCRKAGVGPQSWRDPGAELFGFTVELFSEADFRVGYSISAKSPT
jgi:AmmeMemoRadiSam system protein A